MEICRDPHMDDLYDEGMALMAEATRLLKECIRLANAGQCEEAYRCRAEAGQLRVKADECFALWKKESDETLALKLAGGDMNMPLRNICTET